MAETQNGYAVKFNYPSQLNRREIRLLRFVARRTASDQLLKFDLFTSSLTANDAVSITDQIRYLALSYVWGPPDPKKSIIINDQSFTVRPNLEQALAHLETKIDLPNLPIWVDAVCINQQDSDERGQQVAQMQCIYKNAERTIIWLGEGDETTDQVMTHLDRIGQDAIEAGIEDLNENDFKRWPDIEQNAQKIKTKNNLDRLMPKMAKSYERNAPFPFAAFVDLSYRPWFSRVWIIQELSVAMEYAFMCGQQMIHGDHFIAGFKFCFLWIANELGPLKRNGSLLSLAYRVPILWWQNGWSFIRTLGRVFEGKPFMPSPRAATTLGTRGKFRTKPGITLKTHLARAFTLTSDGSLDASDCKDRIYALLGVAIDRKILEIRPDYKKTIPHQQVYAEVAKLLIHHGHLDILSLCRPGYSREPPYAKPDRDAELPSWSPDWTQPLLTPWGHYIEDQLFQASGKDDFTPGLIGQSKISSKILAVEAYFVDTLKGLGSSWNPKWQESPNFLSILTFFLEVEGALIQPDSKYDNKQREEAIWRIPIGDKEINNLGLVARATEKSHEEYVRLRSLLTTKSFFPRTFPTSVSYLGMMKDMYAAKPFLSDNGYAGLGPDTSAIGDEVWIPRGAHVPYVLRKAEGGFYELVGEAYVYGVMDGETLKDNPRTEVLYLI